MHLYAHALAIAIREARTIEQAAIDTEPRVRASVSNAPVFLCHAIRKPGRQPEAHVLLVQARHLTVSETFSEWPGGRVASHTHLSVSVCRVRRDVKS